MSNINYMWGVCCNVGVDVRISHNSTILTLINLLHYWEYYREFLKATVSCYSFLFHFPRGIEKEEAPVFTPYWPSPWIMSLWSLKVSCSRLLVPGLSLCHLEIAGLCTGFELYSELHSTSCLPLNMPLLLETINVYFQVQQLQQNKPRIKPPFCVLCPQ